MTDKRKSERRGCDPDKCSSVLIERRKTENERRRADDEETKNYEAEVIRKYYEEEARAYREALQGLAKKVFGRKNHDEKKD